MFRILRYPIGILLLALAVGLVGFKGWLELSGPYLEELPLHPFCQEARDALAGDQVATALELARAGGCEAELASAQERWNSLSAHFRRCLGGIWTGEGEGASGITCTVASDLLVFGDVRDLTRQGLRWRAGEDTDPVLIALSTAGIALTLVPQAGAGTSFLKVARRAGSLSDELAGSVVRLVRQREWRLAANLLGDAGRISRKVGPEGARALSYADSPAELTRLADFVEEAHEPLLALRWGGKSVVRLSDDGLYRAALERGPRGLALAAERGTDALLSRKPVLLFLGKAVYKYPEELAAGLLALLALVLPRLGWLTVLAAALVLLLAARLLLRRPRRRRRARGTQTFARP